MRRVTTVLGCLAAAGALALGATGSASAADGTLWINSQANAHPSGCYNALLTVWPTQIDNQTDGTAVVYNQPDCQGEPIAELAPNSGQQVVEWGRSVYVD
ncbi:hypothetical protein ACWC5I_00655 [Kitasatospora sp. NPDC001574]